MDNNDANENYVFDPDSESVDPDQPFEVGSDFFDNPITKEASVKFFGDLRDYITSGNVKDVVLEPNTHIDANELDYTPIVTMYSFSDSQNIFYLSTGKFPQDTEYAEVTLGPGQTTDNINGIPKIQGDGNNPNYVRIIGGVDFNYIADGESGELISNNPLYFYGRGLDGNTSHMGNWTIYTDDFVDPDTGEIYDDDRDTMIQTTDGNNKITTGYARSTIDLGSGNNIVYSQGHDTITSSRGGYQTVTLTGSQSKLTMGGNTTILDIGNNNNISVGKNSSVYGAASDIVQFDTGDMNEYTAGNNSTISATNGTDLKVIHGLDNTYNINHNLTFLNGSGNTVINIKGTLAAFGAGSSQYTLNAENIDSTSGSIFVANEGNETLDAASSSANLQIWANTVAGANNLLAKAGQGDDTLAAGVGNATFTGGVGNNLFMFTKESVQDGTTIITDFTNNDKIALYNYGLGSNGLTQILQQSQNDANGNAVLKLTNNAAIVIEGVSVSSLSTKQFDIADFSH
ncbi:calcium-binding protein [Commensalibacter papalotli (ex Servin-Garciduenas et al. 2014)]|uniref:Outer membrane protein n=1 Tax=Commensalibacter papalotli (ex Servin-Garciduenas et al. 2014) TaxID=1208583 RepID=W7DYF7_9PROT|nr:hypothetical protein [Commensalibacter papalotli (ex Servin-Garciduenas et al. 2014)]EUK17709.1 outer membrane protein [Commensalibacter papalotli (ex Servin-Garciduenas et al. 2014)]